MRLLAAMLVAFASVWGAEVSDTEARVQEAANVMHDIMESPDRGIPQDLLNRAECAIVVPGMKKGAFIVGAKYGRGFMLCRKGGAGWSAPAAVRVEGGSVGLQIGGSDTDVVMLVLNRSGGEKLMSSKFTLGGDAAIAAGPVGRVSTAETDAFMRAEILSWSRSRGVFAGISLKGSTLRPDETGNKQLYGRAMRTRDVILGETAVTDAGKPLVAALTKYSARK